MREIIAPRWPGPQAPEMEIAEKMVILALNGLG
jgi:hypothetical protein